MFHYTISLICTDYVCMYICFRLNQLRQNFHYTFFTPSTRILSAINSFDYLFRRTVGQGYDRISSDLNNAWCSMTKRFFFIFQYYSNARKIHCLLGKLELSFYVSEMAQVEKRFRIHIRYCSYAIRFMPSHSKCIFCKNFIFK